MLSCLCKNRRATLRADLVDVLAPREGPGESLHDTVTKGLLDLLVRGPASVVLVKGCVDGAGVHPSNESTLTVAETTSVDSERVVARVPAGHRIEGPLNENDHISLCRGEAEK